MIEQIKGLPSGVVGFRARGQVTASDYETVLVPDVEAAFALNRKLRMIYHFGADFTGFDAGAMWDDARLGLRHLSGWERVAIVTDVLWLQGAVQMFRFAVPGDLRLFTETQLEEATRWVCESLSD